MKKVEEWIKKETNKVTNDLDKNVEEVKKLLAELGLNNENRGHFDIGSPHPSDPFNQQEPIEYRWLATTTNVGADNQETRKTS